MTRYLNLIEIADLHRQIISQSGGTFGILNLSILQSTVVKPRMSLGGKELFPTLIDKAAILCLAIIINHPFIEGNMRTGHAAMAIFLMINGYEIHAAQDEQEQMISAIASKQVNREQFIIWLNQVVLPVKQLSQTE